MGISTGYSWSCQCNKTIKKTLTRHIWMCFNERACVSSCVEFRCRWFGRVWRLCGSRIAATLEQTNTRRIWGRNCGSKEFKATQRLLSKVVSLHTTRGVTQIRTAFDKSLSSFLPKDTINSGPSSNLQSQRARIILKARSGCDKKRIR